MAAIDQTTTTWLTLDLWHPNCWAIKATGETTGGVLAHSIYTSPKTDGNHSGKVKGLFTAFADDEPAVNDLLDAIRDSEHAGELSELQERFGRERNAPGNVVREFFLEYDPDDMVCPTLLEHGFVHNAPVRIENGREEWQVCFVDERSQIDDALERVREQAGAEVTVDSITTGEAAATTARDQRLDTLTAKQRDVFEHAREAGYYEWPRQCDTRELADDLGVSKTTLLEHLRKAEAKLLDP
ncbi:helix-turn-helix domain-containing protein [Haloarcula salinisoli]|uniref:Helix-turn-helix domain-containing protein n=1 Tax=Haloarcula salinisoli TaxID=2487746 RepID=A0A8J7YHG6_9EURY|nr:helix-turn-helix domain-containing protein [Halomicroarcula salinisoli]MBX0284979.1 helix-turn-helix domain-containing protein [Halomicroarcula salinisoli]MBX0303543.1 helix-turn-helix domain-containing protein [Halomicroarcula salinisoli]